MIRRILTTLLVWSTVILQLHAAGSVTVSNAQGAVGEKVEITVDLTTTTSDAVGAEIHIPLPDGVSPVAGSCVKSDSRLPDHSVSADMKGNEYVVVIFNTSLKPIPAGSGTAFSFKLDLGENPGEFALTPKVRVSDAAGKALSATATGGKLKVIGARLALGATDIDFGRVPIRGTYTRVVTATNTGTATLNIGEITTDVPGLTVRAASQSIEPGKRTSLTLEYKPVVWAKSIAGRFSVLSNSVGRAPFTRVTSVPFSVNELHIGNAEGISDSEVTVSVNLKNMEPIAGAEFSIKLPDVLEYVAESASPSERASGLSALASFGKDRMLRVVLFSTGNGTIDEGDGEVLTFKLKLTGRSGNYSLSPQKVILSNRESENMVSATSGGRVTISSPRLQASSEMNIGNVPLSGTDTFDYQVYNPSSIPLTIEKVVFLDEVAVCNARFPMLVEPRKYGKIPVTIAKPSFGDFSSTMNVYSNDPDNRLKPVAIKGRFYSPNEIYVEKAIENGKCVLTAGLTNEAEIVALQLDVVMPDGVTLTDSDLKLLERAAGHSATLALVGGNRYRVIIFSLNNSAFSGNKGGILSLTFDVTGVEGKEVRFENVKLSSKEGVNFTTPNTEVIVDKLPVMAREIRLSSEALTLKVGERTTLTATVLPENAADKTVTWKSNNEAVATVSAEGVVTGVTVGTVDITAICRNVSAICKVRVIPTPVESIKLSKETAQLKVGETVTLTATVLPENTTDKTVTWKSSNEAVATVSAEGVVTGVTVGTVDITATCGNVLAICKVSVIPTPVESIKLSQETAQLKVGETVSLTATVLPENATDKTVTWKSSNEAVATVSTDGVVTGVTVGTVDIIATCGNVTATCKVTVLPILAESISLDISEMAAIEGDKFIITATVLPENATNKTVEWTSSDSSIAKVNEKGEVEVLRAGKCLITAKTTDGTNLSADCSIEATAGINDVFVDGAAVDIYNIDGILIKPHATKEDFNLLPPGFYIVRGKKILKVN